MEEKGLVSVERALHVNMDNLKSMEKVPSGINESIASSTTSIYSESDALEKVSFCLTSGIFLSDKLLLEAIRGLNGEFRCILPDEIEEYSNEKDKYYFVCEDFSSGIYDKLHKKRCKIVGAPYVISMYRLSRELPELHRPIYNRAMIGVCLCFTGFKNKEEMSRLCRLVHHMGGSVKKEFSGQITHLVASCIYQGSIKYKSALSFGTHIMNGDWIEKAWDQRSDIDFKATEESFIEKWKLRPFQGLRLSFIGFPDDEKKHMEEMSIENGATFLPVGDSRCTHLIVEHSVTDIPTDGSFEHVQIVKQEWFWASIQIDARADESMYLFKDTNASPCVNSASRRSQKRKLRNLELSELLSPDSPLYSNKKRSRDRLSAISSTTLDSSLGSMVEISRDGDIAEEEVLKPAPVPMTARHQISAELQQTEKNYCDTLSTLIKVFKEPLEQSFDQRGGPLLVAEEIKTIFGSLPEIMDVHQSILNDINSLMENWTEESLIGKVIVDHAEKMAKAYPQFVNYFDMAKETVVRCDEERPRFHAFLKICLTKPECGRQSLTELLIRPVQRLPSMSLLINDLLKKTPTSNPDNAQLTKAAETIKRVLTYVNEDRRKTEGQFQMFEIIREVEGCPAYVLSSQRRLVAKANMSEVSDLLSGKGDNLTMFLFTDSIEVTKRKGMKSMKSTANIPLKSPGPSKTPHRNYKHVEFLPFSHIRSLVDITDRGDVRNYFALTYVSPLDARQRMLVFKLSAEIEKKDWLDQLVSLISESNCCAGSENILQQAEPEELKLVRTDSVDGLKRGGTLSRAYKKAKNTTKRVGRAISLTKTPKRTNAIRKTFSSATPNRGLRSQNVSPTPSEMSMVSMVDFETSILDESIRRF